MLHFFGETMKVYLDKISASGYLFNFSADYDEDGIVFSVKEFSGRIFKKNNFFELTASIKFEVSEPCDRCLEIFTEKIESEINILVEKIEKENFLEEEKELSDNELDIYFVESSVLDLNDILRQEAMILRPYKRICNENCKGICSICGQNLNESECDCEIIESDNWQVLNKYIK
jgi:uncharacterized protein